MTPMKSAAHRAGALYFVFMIAGIVQEFLFPTFMVSGDAAATARNITTGEPIYRLGILLGIFSLVLFVFLVVLLYQILRSVDRGQAVLMVLLVGVGVSVSFANLILQFVPLVLLSGTGGLAALARPELEALSLSALQLHGSGSAVVSGFWGLWLFPFGILVIRSRFLPRILGILLLVAGAAYVVFSAVGIVWPEQRKLFFRILMPLFMGEVPIIFWLLIKGVGSQSQRIEEPIGDQA